VVRLLRARQGAPRRARDPLRGDRPGRRSVVPRAAERAHGRLDGPADPDRRPADRRLHRALAPRPRGPARRAARRVGPPERLAAGAVPGTAPGNADLVDRRAAPLARLPAAAVHLELVLRFAASAVRPAVVAQRRALAADPRAERLADALVHR